MSDRPILGVEKPGSLSQQVDQKITAQTPVGSSSDLPLATELPGWDLVPSDTLLVRRRPVKA
jgi:hypothetical protein